MNSSPESWDAARAVLAADALSRTGRLRLRVRGESMLPALWPGDEVELVGCSLQNVSLGEIVLAHREGRLFLHRLVARQEPERFVLRGDAMPASDPSYASAALVGRLVGVLRSGRIVRLRPRVWARPLGRLLYHCGPARRLVLRLQRLRNSWVSLP
jgi:hypothetical protein